MLWRNTGTHAKWFYRDPEEAVRKMMPVLVSWLVTLKNCIDAKKKKKAQKVAN